MLKITLIRPPSVIAVGSYIASITPPIGLAYLAGSLTKAGHNVHIVDAIGLAPNRKENIGGGLLLRGLSYEDIIS